jgi:transcriptional regulator with XRE-family HTH domain
MDPSQQHYGDNLARLLGLHRLTAQRAGRLLQISPQAIYEQQAGKRRPALDSVMRTASFFEIPPDRLMSAEFDDLLAHELADPKRFHRVEKRIADLRRRPGLRSP